LNPDQGVCPSSLEATGTLTILDAAIAENNVTSIWTTWARDPHIDHQAAARIACDLALRHRQLSLWQFPVWGRFTDAELKEGEQLYAFDSSAFLPVKLEAIQTYRSQMSGLISDDPDGFTMEADAQEHFLTFPELFIRKAVQNGET
jgi:LmbE family N-acetylglucosaminyl deacetylase